MDATLRLEIAGLGLMLYSPWALDHVAERSVLHWIARPLRPSVHYGRGGGS